MADVSARAVAPAREPKTDVQTQLLAQKTHLLSELAEAVDNQFNNIMMSVTSYAELELKKASPGARHSLEQVLSNAGRAAHLIQKLLTFSRIRTTAPQYVELNKVITGIAELLQQLLGEQSEVVLNLQPDRQRIKADPVELEELLLSLAVHARNAMSGRGRFSLSTSLVEPEQAATIEKLCPDKYVALSICHSGLANHVDCQPLAAQDLRINLTMAAINRVVEEANGLIRISSGPEQGANFTIYFPAHEEDAPGEAQDTRDESLSTSSTILVVEDDDAVRIPTAEFLKMEGFKVLQAKTGPEAIKIALQKRSPLDLLITDIVMPTMSGREVAKELVEMHPGLKVLYMSGDATEAPVANRLVRDDVLQKPFRLDKLNEKIRALLGN